MIIRRKKDKNIKFKMKNIRYKKSRGPLKWTWFFCDRDAGGGIAYSSSSWIKLHEIFDNDTIVLNEHCPYYAARYV